MAVIPPRLIRGPRPGRGVGVLAGPPLLFCRLTSVLSPNVSILHTPGGSSVFLGLHVPYPLSLESWF